MRRRCLGPVLQMSNFQRCASPYTCLTIFRVLCNHVSQVYGEGKVRRGGLGQFFSLAMWRRVFAAQSRVKEHNLQGDGYILGGMLVSCAHAAQCSGMQCHAVCVELGCTVSMPCICSCSRMPFICKLLSHRLHEAMRFKPYFKAFSLLCRWQVIKKGDGGIAYMHPEKNFGEYGPLGEATDVALALAKE